MTSNIGSQEIKNAFETNQSFKKAEQLAKDNVMNILKLQVRPEFLNRIDEIVLFSPLTRNEIKKIVCLQVKYIQERVKNQQIELIISDEAVSQITKLSFNPEYGGRPVRRILQSHILNPLSKELLLSNLDLKKQILFDVVNEHFIFRNT